MAELSRVPLRVLTKSAPAPVITVPREHGFWVMLAAVLVSSLLRAGMALPSVAVAVVVTTSIVIVAGALHKQVRKSSNAQLASTLALALAGAPIEAAAGLGFSDIAGATAARLLVFSTGLFVVRAALARSSRLGAGRSKLFQLAAVLLPLAGVALFGLLGGSGEALACVLATVFAVFAAAWRPNAKKLKPLGLFLSVLVVGSGLALVL